MLGQTQGAACGRLGTEPVPCRAMPTRVAIGAFIRGKACASRLSWFETRASNASRNMRSAPSDNPRRANPVVSSRRWIGREPRRRRRAVPAVDRSPWRQPRCREQFGRGRSGRSCWCTVLVAGVAAGGGCAARTQTGLLVGGAGGAGVGAAIGSASGNAGKGALIGGAIGLIGGGLIGHAADKSDEAEAEQQRRQEAERRAAEDRRAAADRAAVNRAAADRAIPGRGPRSPSAGAAPHSPRRARRPAAARSSTASISWSLRPGMQGANITTTGTPASRQPAHGVEALLRRRRAGLHGAGELAVEGGDRDRHAHQVPLGHRRQQVEVAQDQAPTW